MTSLSLTSCIADLRLYDCQLTMDMSGQDAMQILNANPHLPGVILTQDWYFVGMISRRRLLEQMSRPYGLDLFYRRPLNQLYQFAKVEHLILTPDTLITVATEKALQRFSTLLDEPIIVEIAPRQYRLLDIHQLLVAHANIFKIMSTLLNEKNEKLKQLTVIDPLTKIGNRRCFELNFGRDWQLAVREEYWVAVILCDVDFFKQYNDTYGHLEGDECLKLIAQCLKKCVRRKSDVLARYGGEEFIISLFNIKKDNVAKMLKKLQDHIAKLERPHRSSQVSEYVTLSFGAVNVKANKSLEIKDLIAWADEALYRAKAEGRNRFIIEEK
ncbi:MAG: GGDEF domain-containing protein [Synechocystis sp.]|nr:GGDEF domain-containing protein [Synechocystis sp.]